MAIVTAIGGRNSNSFVTVSEADSIIATLPDDATAWNALTDEQKEARLVAAASILGMLRWRGRRVYAGQKLCFPRTTQGYRSDIKRKWIPDEVRDSQVEIAYNVVHRALVSRSDVTDGEESASRVTYVSLGGMLSVTFAGDAPTSGNLLDKIGRSINFLTFTRLQFYLTQVRGGPVLNETDRDYPSYSTTSTTSTTSTSTISTSTTSSTT